MSKAPITPCRAGIGCISGLRPPPRLRPQSGIDSVRDNIGAGANPCEALKHEVFMRAILTRLTLLVGLALFPVVQAQAQSDTTPDALRESFRDWVVQCQKIEGDGRACEMVQQVTHGETQQRVMLISFRLDTESRLVGVIVTPFGLRLSEGVQFKVGDAVIAQYGFDTCLAEGCLVVAAFGEKEIAAMRGGIDGEISMVARSGDAVGLPVSFLGFSAALGRLQELFAQ